MNQKFFTSILVATFIFLSGCHISASTLIPLASGLSPIFVQQPTETPSATLTLTPTAEPFTVPDTTWRGIPIMPRAIAATTG